MCNIVLQRRILSAHWRWKLCSCHGATSRISNWESKATTNWNQFIPAKYTKELENFNVMQDLECVKKLGSNLKLCKKKDSRKFLYWWVQPSLLGKKFDSKFLPSIFASSKAFRRQKFSCLFLLAARVHDWIILHSYVGKHIFGKKTFYWPTCI